MNVISAIYLLSAQVILPRVGTWQHLETWAGRHYLLISSEQREVVNSPTTYKVSSLELRISSPYTFMLSKTSFLEDEDAKIKCL